MSSYRLYVSTHAGLPDFDHGEFASARAAELAAMAMPPGSSYKIEGSDGSYASGKTGAEPQFRSGEAEAPSQRKPKARLFGRRTRAGFNPAD